MEETGAHWRKPTRSERERANSTRSGVIKMEHGLLELYAVAL